ncbi:MAG: serine--tRNA ligase [bacterium]|nr:serine--tRNA ligase [bacterium]
MLDIKFIRENKEIIDISAKKKHVDFKVSDLLTVDDKRKKLTASVEKKRAEQNAMSQKIAQATSPEERESLISPMKVVKEALQKEETELQGVMKEWQALMVRVPNVPDISVPEGESDADNVEVRTWGEHTRFTFKPKDHVELMEANDMVDFERGTKVAGFRGYILKNDGALLDFAVWQFVLEHFTKRGLKPMIVPSLVKKELLLGTGYLPQGEEDLYKTQDDMYLAGTGEVAVMGYFGGEVLDKKDLPIKYLAFSPCFRREAGSHGKDVKGIYRVHEFMKFEQLVLCEASHEESVKLHEEITLNAEEMMQALNIPHRVVLNCGADLGLGQVKKYDIEAWTPSKDGYGETHSASYFHDFQTRRLNIRYRDEDGKMRFVHSLNNTATATPRLLISIVENYQNEDGTIRVPEVLKKYIGKDILGKPKA